VGPREAANTNALDEVPDSTWFTNRHARRRLSAEALAQGPNTGHPPSATGPLVVLSGKSLGMTPGFVMRDAKGDRYVVKFDPPDYPDLATGAELVCGDGRQRFTGISIDSRTIAAGQLFVAIRGDVHDGHRFVPDVLDRGVRGLLVDCRHLGTLPEAARTAGRLTCAAVADTTRALGELGAFHRNRSRAAVIAVTGSNGKTSTRRMIAAVLSHRFRVLEADRNLNNQIGVPLTLFRITPEHEWAILEFGTNMPGEIARLAQIGTPEIGVITNIGPAHLEGLGSLEGILAEKSALLFGLRAGGRAVLNADDPRLRKLAHGPDPQTLLFGLSADAAVRAARVQDAAAGLDFELMLPAESVRVHLDAHGRFMVQNALAAAAVGHLLGLSGRLPDFKVQPFVASIADEPR